MGHRRSHRPAHLRKNLRKTAGMPTISPGFGTPLIPVTTISGLPLFQSIGVLSSKNMQSISLLRIEPPIPSTCGCDNLDIYFLHFFSQRYPQATDLHELSTQDVDDFTSWIRADVQRRKLKNSNTYVNHHIQALAGWLSYLERTDHPIKPHLPLPRLIWPHHYPPLDHRSPSSTIKYIPQAVLEQLDRHLHQLTAVYIPVMIVLRASGWRISDVLALKWETCLEQQNEKYCLVGDIQKTRVLGHRIPISQEVAAVIQAQIAWVKQHYTPQENPHGWLFPASKDFHQGKSQRFLHGDPLAAGGIRDRLNHLAVTHGICDEHGNLFHFRLHAFRHTKAVELINNGMSLVLVQQWMAHASPEMTLIYAKILDETMRTAWEKTVQQGCKSQH